MIKSLLKLAFILIVGILIYNYFLGTDSEKETSQKIFKEAKELVLSVTDLVKNEKEKFDDGKYDQALDKIGKVFKSVKEKVKDNKDVLDKIKELDKKREELQDDLEDIKTEKDSTKNVDKKEDLKNELDKLLREAKDLLEEYE